MQKKKDEKTRRRWREQKKKTFVQSSAGCKFYALLFPHYIHGIFHYALSSLVISILWFLIIIIRKKRRILLFFFHRCRSRCVYVLSMLSQAIQHLHKTEWNIRKVYNNRLCGAFNRIMVAEWERERESDCERVKLCKGKSQNAKHLARDECMCNNKSQINSGSLAHSSLAFFSLLAPERKKSEQKKTMQTEIRESERK